MKKIFAANWKLFKSPQETREYFKNFKALQTNLTGEVIFFPPAVSLEAASESLKGTTLNFGAQNCYAQSSGAFTGENSAAMVKSLGGRYVLVGHSERRKIFAEDDHLIADKVAFIQSLEMTPVLCIGETLQEREATRTFRVLETQLLLGLAKADKAKPLIVAYEPVWAIGTGRVATPEQVAETHKDVHQILTQVGFDTTPILYGGSVKPENASLLIQQAHVSGFLVGGASLEPPSFAAIASV